MTPGIFEAKTSVGMSRPLRTNAVLRLMASFPLMAMLVWMSLATSLLIRNHVAIGCGQLPTSVVPLVAPYPSSVGVTPV